MIKIDLLKCTIKPDIASHLITYILIQETKSLTEFLIVCQSQDLVVT